MSDDLLKEVLVRILYNQSCIWSGQPEHKLGDNIIVENAKLIEKLLKEK